MVISFLKIVVFIKLLSDISIAAAVLVGLFKYSFKCNVMPVKPIVPKEGETNCVLVVALEEPPASELASMNPLVEPENV